MVQKQLVKTYCFSPFLLQHSRAVRSDETEKTLQAIERNEEKKLTTFVTDKDRIGFCGFRCGGTGDDEAAKGDVIAQ